MNTSKAIVVTHCGGITLPTYLDFSKQLIPVLLKVGYPVTNYTDCREQPVPLSGQTAFGGC